MKAYGTYVVAVDGVVVGGELGLCGGGEGGEDEGEREDEISQEAVIVVVAGDGNNVKKGGNVCL